MHKQVGSLHKPNAQEYITIVSGLPRSGTSMMMKMLEAGGLMLLTDNLRTADEDNPRGYYEFDRVKKMRDGDTSWIENAPGKAVKVISALLEYLPSTYNYRVLFMERKIEEILASQKQMLIRSGKSKQQLDDEHMARLYSKHLAKISAWLDKQTNISVIYLSYNAMIADPHKYTSQVNQFLDNSLNQQEMARVVDPNLYRQRR